MIQQVEVLRTELKVCLTIDWEDAEQTAIPIDVAGAVELAFLDVAKAAVGRLREGCCVQETL